MQWKIQAIWQLKKTKHWHFDLHKLLPWILPVSLISLWQLSASIGLMDSSVSPIAVIQDGISLSQTGELPTNISISLYRASMGLLIGGSAGFIFGFLNGISSIFRDVFDTSIQMLRNIPHLSLIPLVIIIFGIGETAKISLVAVGVMFPIYINTFHGIRSVDPKLIEMGRSYGLNKWQLLTKIIIPGALPTILMGLRYALGVMWTTLIVAETISSSSGIGYMATSAQDYMDITTVVLCIAIYAILGKVSDLIAKALEGIFLQWQNGKGNTANG
ncbi:ABC transporter permease subunit [Paucilactobacillus hokkaidonensis]|uniref:ABC transporter permease subunit n=1 Tax=Paucilactobacillus hokkaidonensis TaxID=1193095 RepID=UPI000A62BBB3|nr:ABC transporter permease subunit [Paucilactobacillus hokkaidonensis]